MSSSPSFYDLLGVARDATVEEIKKAYKKAALTHHPDKGGDPEKFKDLGAAMETLTDDRKRAAYDSSLVRARSKDGMGAGGFSADRRGSASARQPDRAAPPGQAGGAAPRPAATRPPRAPAGAVEIPSDPSSLSIKELKELLSALGMDHEGCLEKADLLELLQSRKDRKAASTPRGSSGAAAASPRAQPPPRPEPAAPASAPPPAPDKPSQADGPRALRVKLLSLGSGAVGKSTLIKRYCEGRFVQKYITTIGIDYGVKPVKIQGIDVKVNFFDTSGGEEFKDIRVEFYAKTNGVMLVYDVTSRSSFTDLDGWLAEASMNGCPLSKLHKVGDMPYVILCANKTDLRGRAVTREEGMEFAQRHGMHYYETSASSGESVVDALNFVFDKVVGRHLDVRKRLAAGG